MKNRRRAQSVLWCHPSCWALGRASGEKTRFVALIGLRFQEDKEAASEVPTHTEVFMTVAGREGKSDSAVNRHSWFGHNHILDHS